MEAIRRYRYVNFLRKLWFFNNNLFSKLNFVTLRTFPHFACHISNDWCKMSVKYVPPSAALYGQDTKPSRFSFSHQHLRSLSNLTIHYSTISSLKISLIIFIPFILIDNSIPEKYSLNFELYFGKICRYLSSIIV